jgi:predicted phosphate transport protein (TIGR00153 family)
LSKKILGWLDRRKKITTIQLVRRHLELTIGTVEELSKAIRMKANGDKKLIVSSVNRIADYEKEADALRRQISLEVAKSELPPSEREDLLQFVRSIDWIADWTLEAARILVPTPINKLSPELVDVIYEMIDKVKEAVHLVVRCVDKLSENLEDTLNLAEQVERAEEEVDGLYQKARSYYPNLNYEEINPGEVVLVSQFIDAVEVIADWCENTIDQIRLIAIGLI